jgi:hypothetical protein
MAPQEKSILALARASRGSQRLIAKMIRGRRFDF